MCSGRVLINLSRTGVRPEGELNDMSRADVAAARAAIARHRDMIVGVKARLSFNVAGARRSRGAASARRRSRADLPVMIHMGQTVSPMPRLLASAQARRHRHAHVSRRRRNSILDDSGRILPEVLAARKRGVWFDVGNGRNGHLWWDVAERAMKQGFWPDTHLHRLDTSDGRTAQVSSTFRTACRSSCCSACRSTR